MKLSDEQLKEFADKIKRDDFAAQLNTKFRVNHEVDAELIEVSEIKKYPRQESFSLLFQFPENVAPIQGMFTFEHPQLGTHEIFIVPIEEADEGGLVFEAAFNRLLPKDQR